MIEQKHLIIIFSLLLLIFLLFKEIRRSNKSGMPLRIVMTFLSLISLILMAIPITYHGSEWDSIEKEAVILTEGYNKDSVIQFLNSKKNQVPVFALDENIHPEIRGITYIKGQPGAKSDFSKINRFHVFGFGMEEEEWINMPKASFLFHPSNIPSGISFIYWGQKIKLGDKLVVQGKFRNVSGAPVKIVLSNFNTTIDSVIVAAGVEDNFQLQAIPSLLGRSFYIISAIAGKHSLENEILPIQVEQGDPLNILFLSSAPDFENKFLQEYLAQHGARVVTRTTISKEKYATSFLNISQMPLNKINYTVLEKFDLIISDPLAITEITAAEREAIKNQIFQRGVGIIIKTDSHSASPDLFGTRFEMAHLPVKEGQFIKLNLPDSTIHLPGLAGSDQIYILNQAGKESLVEDNQKRSFVSRAILGSGKIILSTISNTYSWILSGKLPEYAGYWSALINKASILQVEKEDWTFSPFFPEINKMMQLKLQTDLRETPKGQIDGSRIYLEQNMGLPYEWNGRFYPLVAGWQEGTQLNGEPYYVYAYSPGSWKYIHLKEKMESTENHIKIGNSIKNDLNIKRFSIENKVPIIYFFLLFLLSAGYLWWENKKILSAVG